MEKISTPIQINTNREECQMLMRNIIKNEVTG